MDNKIGYLLVGLLVIASFVGGSAWTKFLVGSQKQPGVQVAQGGNQQGSAQPQQQAAVPEEPKVLGVEEQAEIVKNPAASKGREDAKVTIVEFSEFQCPFCKRYVDETYGKIMKEYGDKIYYLFHDFPLEFHQHAQITAEAARCAGDQGKYWEYHDKLFADQQRWVSQEDASDVLVVFAGELGLDKEKFNSCLTQGKFKQAVKDDITLGQKVGVSGTPSFFINGKMLVGAQPYGMFKGIIEEGIK